MFKKIIVYIFLYLLTIGIILSVFFLAPNEVNRFPFLRLIIIIFATVLLIKYFIYMIISPWYDVILSYRKRTIKNKKKYLPRVSVVVPAWNEEVGILTTIESLINNSYKNLEVIIIDNASTDNTYKNVKLYIKKYYHRLKKTNKKMQDMSASIDSRNVDIICVREEKKGKGYALNKGINIASGDILISIDADCFVLPETVGNFVHHFKDPAVMGAVGNVKIGNIRAIIGVVQYLEFLFSFYFKKSDSILGSIYIIGGAAGAFRKEVFKRLGGYDVSCITEDIDLSVRMQNEGMKIVYAEDALVYTEGATDYNGLVKQRLRWKRGRLETFLKYRQLFFSSNKKHNKLLSWFILPLAIFGDMQLSLELLFILFIYIYSYLTNDFTSFISGIIVVGFMFIIQIIFDVNKKNLWQLIILAPIGWLLLYVTTFIEFNALIKAFLGYLKKEKVEWQMWKRKGVFVSSSDIEEINN